MGDERNSHKKRTNTLKADNPTRVAVIQHGSILFDREACLEKVETLATEAADRGAELVLFPEAFIPGYPRGFSFGTVVGSRSDEGRSLYSRYAEQSITIGDHSTSRLEEVARSLNIVLAIGAIERAAAGGTLYCTLLIFCPENGLVHRHRKIKPTGLERVIWGEGDGTTLTSVSTRVGKTGGLICWENMMPLARTALYESGIEIYLAPTADQRESWQATMQFIAMEGRCFVLGCNQFVTKDLYPYDLLESAEVAALPDPVCRGGSVIVSPLGDILAGPVFDKADILFADLNRKTMTGARLDFDVVGHYARPDLLKLKRE